MCAPRPEVARPGGHRYPGDPGLGGLVLGLGLGVAGFLTLVLLASVLAVSLCGQREHCLLEEEGREEGREEGFLEEEKREEGREEERREEGRREGKEEGGGKEREGREWWRRLGRWWEGRNVLFQGGAGRREKDYIECI